jgi:tetratricopeptide (TPR) repeat protein
MSGLPVKALGEREALLHAIELHRSGRVDDAIAGYRLVLASNPGQFDAWRLLGAALLTSGQSAEAVVALARALSISQAMPEVWAQLGDAHLRLGSNAQAAECYECALAIDPRRAGAWANRGTALERLGRAVEALESHERAVLAAPTSAPLWCNLGLAQAGRHRFEESLASYERAVSCDPASHEAWRGMAAVLTSLGRYTDALASCERALAFQPLGQTHGAAPPDRALTFCRGLLQLTLGNFSSGWEGFEARRHAGATLPAGVALWQRGAPVMGSRILLAHEQGLGDTIQFCRFAPQIAAAGAMVTLQVPPSLLSLMSTLVGEIQVVSTDSSVPAVDLACLLPSVAHRLDVDLPGIPSTPYLAADPMKRRQWAERLGERHKPRIGLVASGNPNHDNDAARSIPLREFESLLGMDFEWHLLQRELSPDDETALLGLPIADHRHQLGDFSDTAALAAEMDLVVSVDTAVAHLAGALGLPLFVLLAFVPDWRWLLEREDSPWYPSARLFRQSRRDDWRPVLGRVADALAQLARRSDAPSDHQPDRLS